MSCGTQTGLAGQAAAATSSFGPPRLLRRHRQRLRKPLQPRRHRDGRQRRLAASAARADIGLSKLDLIGGTITIRIIEPPSLNVLATGRQETSAVDYHAPCWRSPSPASAPKNSTHPANP